MSLFGNKQNIVIILNLTFGQLQLSLGKTAPPRLCIALWILCWRSGKDGTCKWEIKDLIFINLSTIYLTIHFILFSFFCCLIAQTQFEVRSMYLVFIAGTLNNTTCRPTLSRINYYGKKIWWSGLDEQHYPDQKQLHGRSLHPTAIAPQVRCSNGMMYIYKTSGSISWIKDPLH